MNENSIPLGLYIRFDGAAGLEEGLSAVDVPSWEICRQDIRQAGDQIALTEQVILSGLTLRRAWSALAAFKENLS